MYHFNWEQIIQSSLIKKCQSLSKDKKTKEEQIHLLIAQILNSVGGLNVASSNWSKAHRAKIATKLLNEAIKHLLYRRYAIQISQSGHYADNAFHIKSHEKLNINSADKTELDALPVIGKVLAQRIIDNRRTSGGFTSLNELNERIDGLGDEGVKKLEGILSFNDSWHREGKAADSFENNFARAYSMHKAMNSENTLLSFLEELSTFNAANPHPATKWERKRVELEPANSAVENIKEFSASKTSILVDKLYYPHVIDQIKQAKKCIDICMFFLSFGGNKHPNIALLDLIIEKSKAGIKIRILLDKDRDDDPYGSRIINSKAAKYLSDKGVQVRFDRTDKLLHSKLVIIDNERVIIGSHNWTKASYTQYKDLSFDLIGTRLGKYYTNRFDGLWEDGVV